MHFYFYVLIMAANDWCDILVDYLVGNKHFSLILSYNWQIIIYFHKIQQILYAYLVKYNQVH